MVFRFLSIYMLSLIVVIAVGCSGEEAQTRQNLPGEACAPEGVRDGSLVCLGGQWGYDDPDSGRTDIDDLLPRRDAGPVEDTSTAEDVAVDAGADVAGDTGADASDVHEDVESDADLDATADADHDATADAGDDVQTDADIL